MILCTPEAYILRTLYVAVDFLIVPYKGLLYGWGGGAST
jgi:hypothetical protein